MMAGDIFQDRPEVLQAFQDGWALADDLGLEGQRVAEGLASALSALEGNAPVGSYIVLDVALARKMVQVSLSALQAVVDPTVAYLRRTGMLDGTGL